VFPIRYVDIRYIWNLLSPFGATMSSEPNLNAISVRASAATLTSIDEIIKRFDIPANASRNIDLTVHLLLATGQTDPDSFPAALKPVIDQLRSIMTYKSYQVVDTILARGTEGDTITTSGMTAKFSATDLSAPNYQFSVRPRVAGEGQDQFVHLDNLGFTVTVNVSGSAPQSLRIDTALDVKKAQQVVVGKATMSDRALILVLSAKIVD